MQLIIKFQKQCLKSFDTLKSKLEFYPEVIFIKKKLNLDEVSEETKKETNVQANSEDEKEEEKCKSMKTDLSSDGNNEAPLDDPAPTDDDDVEQSDEASEAPLVTNEVKKRGKYKMKTVPRKNKKDEKRHYCTQCDCSYVKSIALTRHILKKHQGGSQCRYCFKVFLNEEEFKQHLKEEEAKPRLDTIFCCELCGYTSKYKSGLRHHITKFQYVYIFVHHKG